MKEEAIFRPLSSARERTLQLIESISEEYWDEIPSGFRNNIRWNVGHILTVHEFFAFGPGSKHLPESYPTFFNKDTKPADWVSTPPSKAELLGYLKEQPSRVENALQGKLANPLRNSFLGMETVGELLVFSSFHEGMHVGVINALAKVVTRASK